MTTALVAMKDLKPGDKLPYYTCSCDCIAGPCEHGPEIWIVESVTMVDTSDPWVGGSTYPIVTFTSGRREVGPLELVVYR